jgi:formylmethanofuran dehydrogenase subunit E
MAEKLKGDFRKYMDKSFLGAWDLNETGDTILTIDHVERNEVKNERGSESKMTVHFVERDYKPMICNTTNAKAISSAVGSTKVENWEKKKIALYKATITAFGQTTECIRVREYAPKTDEIYCEVCGELVTDHDADGKTYKAKAIANNAFTKFGKYMCFDCASAAKAEQEAEG